MRSERIAWLVHRVVLGAAAAFLMIGLMGNTTFAQRIDQEKGPVGAVQHGSNTSLAGNGGGSDIDNAPAEIAVGDIATGSNTGGANSNTISISSTIEEQSSEANGGDDNTARVSDDDPVTDDRDVRIDRGFETSTSLACDGDFLPANGGIAEGSANGGAIGNGDGDSTSNANAGTGIADSSGGDPFFCNI